jgi:hypothetical protein
MAYDPIEEARALARKEELEKANLPKAFINTRFMEVLDYNDQAFLINIDMIQTVCARSVGGSCIYFDNEPNALLVKHRYTDIKNALKQYYR